MKKDKTKDERTERVERMDGDGRKKKTWLGILLIVLEVIVIIVLAIILINQKKRNDADEDKKQQEAQEQYHQIEENKAQVALANYLYINEVNKSGDVEIFNNSAFNSEFNEECALYVNGEKCIVYEGSIKSKGVVSANCGKTLKKGDYLVLYYGNDICDSLFLPDMIDGASYGRNSDNLYVYAYLESSIGEGNDGKAVMILDNPYISAPSGFYDDAFELYVFKKDDQKVYYTLDGTEPTLESKCYEGPIRITNVSGQDNKYSAIADASVVDGIPSSDVDKCVCLRLCAITDEGKKGKEITGNFFVGYSTKTAFKNIPTLTLITDPDSMFDYFEGGYVLGRAYEDAIARGNNGNNAAAADYYMGWESKGRLEFYEDNKTLSAMTDVTFSVKTDNATDYSQKTLKVQIGKGDGLDNTSMSKYLHGTSNTFLLDASGFDNTYKLRDLLANDLLSETAVLTREITPVSVFIDGEYWGIYCMQDYYDKDYLSAKLGIAKNNIALADSDTENDLYEDDIVLYYELYDAVVNHDLTIPENYEKVKSMMDIQSFLDCFCSHIYIGDSEYPLDDDYVWRSKTVGTAEGEDGKWHWAFGNADNSMKISKVTNFSVDTYLRPQVAGDEFLLALMRNEEFNKQFVDTITRMGEEVFAPEKVETWLADAVNELSKAIIRTSLRFGVTITDTSVSNQAALIQKFFNERAYYINIYTQEFSEECLRREFVLAEEPVVSEANEDAKDASSEEKDAEADNGSGIEVEAESEKKD
ncbi:MAG: CotH kinase family protein [Lachnospiraceae bacterium]|nr:CotH kinase family protein [Lachnospiraceae bacterium]